MAEIIKNVTEKKKHDLGEILKLVNKGYSIKFEKNHFGTYITFNITGNGLEIQEELDKILEMGLINDSSSYNYYRVMLEDYHKDFNGKKIKVRRKSYIPYGVDEAVTNENGDFKIKKELLDEINYSKLSIKIPKELFK
jgi:hypothetical protein